MQAFDRLSADARFMRSVRELNLDRLRNALASFPDSGIGIVATVPAADGIRLSLGIRARRSLLTMRHRPSCSAW